MENVSQTSARAQSVVATGGQYVRLLRERDVTYHAAALSYYTIVSVVPLFTLLLFVTTVFHQESVATAVTNFTRAYLLPAGEDEVLEALHRFSQTSHYTLVGLAVSLWGALKLFTALGRSFEDIFESGPASPKRQIAVGFLTFLTVGLAVVAVAMLFAAFHLVDHPHSHYGPFVLVVVLTAVFFPIYYFLPNVTHRPRDALPGALFAAVGWTVLGTGFAVYVDLVGRDVSGVLGAFLLLLTWFYFAGLTLLLGGVLNAFRLGIE